MTTEDIADFCAVKACRVFFGSPEAGYVQMDGTGVSRKSNNYRRFLAHGELASLPPPNKVLESAAAFVVDDGSGLRELTREEFIQELVCFQRLAGI